MIGGKGQHLVVADLQPMSMVSVKPTNGWFVFWKSSDELMMVLISSRRLIIVFMIGAMSSCSGGNRSCLPALPDDGRDCGADTAAHFPDGRGSGSGEPCILQPFRFEISILVMSLPLGI